MLTRKSKRSKYKLVENLNIRNNKNQYFKCKKV
jgi:hypothetical protein